IPRRRYFDGHGRGINVWREKDNLAKLTRLVRAFGFINRLANTFSCLSPGRAFSKLSYKQTPKFVGDYSAHEPNHLPAQSGYNSANSLCLLVFQSTTYRC